MSSHAPSLNDSCVTPSMVATVSDQVTATTRRALEPEISQADVEAVLNTVIALESGQGPKPAFTTADYYHQVARLSGRSYYVVATVLPAYIATLSGVTTDASKDGPTATKDASTMPSSTSEAKPSSGASTGGTSTNGTTVTGSRSGILFAIGGLLGLIALVAYVAKRGQA